MNSPTARSMFPAIPQGEVLGRYREYTEAQRVVDFLADEKFEVQHLSIIGRDVALVENVVGRLSYAKVALSGALNGAMLGAFVGLILILLAGNENPFSIVFSVGIGAAMFMLLSVLQYSFSAGRRDFSSINSLAAQSYDVLVSVESAAQARTVLSKMPDQPRSLQSERSTTAGQAGTADSAGTHEAGSTPSQFYQDLPDGRPQFGVREDSSEEGKH